MSASNQVLAKSSFVKVQDCKYKTCIVCLDDLKNNPFLPAMAYYSIIFRTHCGHEFHSYCLLQWLDSSMESNNMKHGKCPICRQCIPDHDAITLWALINDCLSTTQPMVHDVKDNACDSR